MSSPSPRIRMIEVLIIVLALAIATGCVVGSIRFHREEARILRCSANLRGIGSALFIYAQDGDDFPALFDRSRAGEMSNFAYRNRQPRPFDIPSPTAELWTVVREYYSSIPQFNCPSTTDSPDPVQYGSSAFDFAGPDHLSYAYAYQYHPGRPVLGTGSDPRIPLMRDANPYLKGGLSNSVSDDRKSNGAGNSVNHRFRRGQSVLFVDGSVSFHSSPRMPGSPAIQGITGSLPADNIYTAHADNEPSDPGNAPTWTRIQIGSKSDYCLVP